MAPSRTYHPCRRGLVALGDSITVGDGEPMLGLPCRSWALWLAEALELPYTNLAADGAQVDDLLAAQVARMRGPYELGCVYVGVNDARDPEFGGDAFERTLHELLRRTRLVCDHLLVATLPRDLGRPRAGGIARANGAIRSAASLTATTVVELDDLHGWRLVLPDAVHLTALGQLDIARRAANALRADGLALPREPGDRAEIHTGWGATARYALTGYAGALASDLRRRVREGTLGETVRQAAAAAVRR